MMSTALVGSTSTSISTTAWDISQRRETVLTLHCLPYCVHDKTFRVVDRVESLCSVRLHEAEKASKTLPRNGESKADRSKEV